ncbi:hypothetical protein TEA_016969 [Camellia sinensis var. sinensis]|uniref:Uncharacterized protein n=1 Tax=Camellia sinensis var. sinensis TaxID=542762 RepID=A0A4S4D048_CAMSN|nr:hypothetical protein TEA_016969 [Camellia sinensis var. sinensis]
MSQNRSFQDGSQHQSTMDSAFTRLQQGLMMTPESEIQHVIEPFLEPLVLKISIKVLGGEGEGQCQSQPERSVRREVYPYVVGMENSMCVSGHMVNAIGGTSLTPASVDIMSRQSFINPPTQIYGVGTSLTPSDCIGGTPGFMRTQQSMTATHQIYGAVPSSFVDFNVQMNHNDRGGSFHNSTFSWGLGVGIMRIMSAEKAEINLSRKHGESREASPVGRWRETRSSSVVRSCARRVAGVVEVAFNLDRRRGWRAALVRSGRWCCRALEKRRKNRDSLQMYCVLKMNLKFEMNKKEREMGKFASVFHIQQLEDGKGDNKTSEDDVSSLKKVVEVMVIQRVHHVIEPLMEHLLRKAAKVVIESVVDKVLTRRRLFTCLKVALVDGLTGEVVNSGLEALAKVEIVVLRGDFDDDEGQDWTLEEFNRNIVREREGNKPLLSGNACLNLREGIGFVGEISFTHTSIWMNNCKFRLGARILDNFNGTRVIEAKTEPFIIKDRRGKLYKKLDSPSLSDAVWRLKNIGRRGAVPKRLSDGNIKTTLGTHMSDKMLKETVDHALTNKLDDWYSYYSGSSQQKFGVVFNVGGQVLGILSECRYVPVEKLSATQKVDAHKLVVSAFEHWGEVVSVDRNSLSCDSSNLSNALHSNSPILENPISHNNGTSPGIFSPDYFNRNVSSPDDFGISDMDLMRSLPWSPPYDFSKSMIQGCEEECPQFCGDHCNTQAVIPGIESHTDQQSDKSDTGLVGDQAVKAQKIWLKTSIVLRFQQRIRIVNSTQKRQRCS